MPKARIATTDAWTPTLSRLRAVRKSGVAMNIATHTTMRPTSAPLSDRICPILSFVVRLPGAGMVVDSVDTGGLDLLDRQRHDGILACLGSGQLTDDPSVGHDDDAVADAEDLG